MHITFDQNPNEKINKEMNVNSQMSQISRASTGSKMTKLNGSTGVFFSPSDSKNQVYQEKGKNFTDIMDEMSSKDASLYKNYMAVMAGTMSAEDFQKMTKEGVNPGKVDVRDAVTIMDHIKAVMAESGVVISGFNDLSNMSDEKLTEITGDMGYTNALKNAFRQNDLPLNEDCVQEVVDLTNQTMSISELTDDMKQYLLENELPVSPDQIYRAQFSTSGVNNTGHGGYFADELNGYYGKQPQSVDINALEKQIREIAKEADLEYNETVKEEAKWLLDKGIYLTSRNLKAFDDMNQLSFPLNRDDLVEQMAKALREGMSAGDANLIGPSIYENAENILKEVNSISNQAVKQVADEGQIITIRSLSQMQRQIQLSVQIESNAEINQNDLVNNEIKDDSFLHARRMLEEVRLKMTLSANISLLKSNYAIETAPLEDLVEKLKITEEKQASFGITLSQSEQSLYAETMNKTEAIKQMPIALIPVVYNSKNAYTINEVYKQGQILQSTYQKAGESYEALMTAPRADLGDRIKDAFRNIDDILADENMEAVEANRRAVRILAYNQMEISKESIVSVRSADEELRGLLDLMTGPATLQMIRDGVNPLEQSIPELHQYFREKEDTLDNQTEKFSSFLRKLDQSGQISEDERKALIGIYRLIRQIEKGDGKAIGTVVANGQNMSFANLLTAVRTNKTNSISETIGESYGVKTSTIDNDKSISEQIASYYQSRAGKMLDKIIPEVISNAQTMDMTWERLDEALQIRELDERENQEFVNEQLLSLKESLTGSEDSLEFLLENDVMVSADYLLAAKDFVNGESVYKKIMERFEKIGTNSDLEKGEDENSDVLSSFMDSVANLTEKFTSKEDAQEAFDVFVKSISNQLEEQMMSDEATTLDIKTLSLRAKQLSLASAMTKNESYELPAIIMGEVTDVNIKFIQNHHKSQSGATLHILLSDKKELLADFSIKGDKLVGFVGCNDKSLQEEISEKTKDFKANLLLKMQKEADISVIHSETLLQSAGKPVQNNSLQNEDQQGREQSSRQLYQAVQEFIKALR